MSLKTTIGNTDNLGYRYVVIRACTLLMLPFVNGIASGKVIKILELFNLQIMNGEVLIAIGPNRNDIKTRT